MATFSARHARAARLSLRCLGMAAVGGSACGTGTSPSAEVTPPDALTCAQTSWTVVHSFGEHLEVPSNLALHNGVAFISVGTLGILALPTAGGDPVVLTTETATKLWIEGESIYFGKEDDKLRKVPLVGGTSTVVVDGMTSFVAPAYGAPADVALDASYFYWDLSSQEGPNTWTVWRAPRAGGSAEKLADLPVRHPAYSWPTLTLTPDKLIVSVNTQDVAYAVPLAGGSMRDLPSPPVAANLTANVLVGTSEAGVLWTNEAWPSGARFPTTHMSISDANDPSAAAARPFWPEKPPFMRPWPMASWADGAGGWFITGQENLADGSVHTTVWDVNSAGTTGTRVACDPTDGNGSVWSTVATPEAVYAVVSAGSSTSSLDEWLLVRMDRTPVAPAGP
ncbi:MAG: hypothetical protein JWM82_2371 [Myxococcales bacterium]|nr:hypothetical protein [Myxococcales bacterium]